MLRPCSKHEFWQYSDFAYSLAMDLTKSGYPTCCDGIKTKEWFINRSLEAFGRDDEEMLVFEHAGRVQGFIHAYWLADDKYLSTASFNIADHIALALEEFCEWAQSRFNGYELYLGFPEENSEAVGCLRVKGFELIKETYNNTAFLEKCNAAPIGKDIVRIGRQNYGLFRALHAQKEADMYWNSDRILADLNHWIVLTEVSNGEPQGTIYVKKCGDGWYEIFGIDTKKHDTGLLRRLLEAALNKAKKSSARFMTFFCDEEDEDILKETGFICIGKYLCFKNMVYLVCSNIRIQLPNRKSIQPQTV